MADKPSRALVLYAAGHAALLPRAAAGKSHLDAFAARAACGFLSLRTPTTTVNGTDPPRPCLPHLAPALKLRNFRFHSSI
jgi:hypothetical protein